MSKASNHVFTAGAAAEATYIEDVFSTYSYYGNASYREIQNDIKLASGPKIPIGTEIGGGFFAGYISNTGYGAPTHVLIVAGIDGESLGRMWQSSASSVTGASSTTDGVSNTNNLAEKIDTSHPAALYGYNKSLNGYTDWYLPAISELGLIYSGFYSGFTQVTSFKTGGVNAFSTSSDYWSSTQGSSTTGLAVNFGNGSVGGVAKQNTARYTRVVRRIPIDDPLLTSYNVSGAGGMVWIKSRTETTSNYLFNTDRGARKALSSDLTTAETTFSDSLTAFTPSGFQVGGATGINTGGERYVSWSFRKKSKFFDVVTYTGNATNGRAIPHSLGSTPGFIIVKRTDAAGYSWNVWHRAGYYGTSNGRGRLESTVAFSVDNGAIWGNASTSTHIDPTSTDFYISSNAQVNVSGGTYVAYIFAHDAGGFGLTGTDNVISCGSYTCDGSGNFSVNLGWEPQWILYKHTNSSTSADWFIVDNMRGMPATASSTTYLQANTTAADATGANTQPNATGFSGSFVASAEFIYIAIRRGPMKVPTDATKVFSPVAYTGTGASLTTTTGINQDSLLIKPRIQTYSALFTDRLRGVGGYWLDTASNAVENGTNNTAVTALDNTSFTQGGGSLVGGSAKTYVAYGLTRAPSFFDVVCYTGTGSARTINHNLGVAPELMIVKRRTVSTGDWYVYTASVGNTSTMYLNLSNAPDASAGYWNNTTPTSSVFSIGTNVGLNASGSTYVAYLFATCAGVSKVGSYTGTGTTQTIDCGFAAGARFVLVKRTDSTGDWYVWDTARGIVAGNDPYLLLNDTAAEVTSTDYIDPYSAGFELSSTAPSAINANGGTFIFLAIA